MDPADPTALWLDPPLPTESEPLPQVPWLLETTLAVLLCVPVGLVRRACASSRVRTWAHLRRALVLAHAIEGYIQVGQREWSLPRAIAAAFATSPTLTIARASEGVGDGAGVSHVADGARAEVTGRVAVQGALPPVVAVAQVAVAPRAPREHLARLRHHRRVVRPAGDARDALALDAAHGLSRRLLGVDPLDLQTAYVPRTAHLASAAPLFVVCSRWDGELQPSSLADWRWMSRI